MSIRPETEPSFPAIRRVLEAAFDTPAEAGLVETLREQAHPHISLVAEQAGDVVGHIMFTPCPTGSVKIMGLAPLAVLPAHQKHGFGTALVRAGLDHCRELGFAAVIVLGHAQYYPKFGFVPASRFGIRCEYDVPDEVFMALELQPDGLAAIEGLVKYHPAFAGL
jgi:putative acetyltransferase